MLANSAFYSPLLSFFYAPSITSNYQRHGSALRTSFNKFSTYFAELIENEQASNRFRGRFEQEIETLSEITFSNCYIKVVKEGVLTNRNNHRQKRFSYVLGTCMVPISVLS